jgi:hypothetical protein
METYKEFKHAMLYCWVDHKPYTTEHYWFVVILNDSVKINLN